MREFTTPAVVEVPACAQLTDVVYDRAAHNPGAMVYRRRTAAAAGASPAGAAGAWEDVTAGQFAAQVTAFANGLIAAGIGQGDRVALMSRTRYEWTLADYGIWAAGAVTVPIYETSSPEQVEWVLSDSGARALIAETPAHLADLADVLGRHPEVAHVWLIDGDAAGAAVPAQPLAALASDGSGLDDTEVQRRRTVGAASDIASIIYTSGTTGKPKGCVLTHANLLADARNAIKGPLVESISIPGASTLLFLPLAHSFARIIEVGFQEAGIPLGHTADLADLLGDLASFRPTFLLAVPRVFEKVYNGAEQKAAASPVRNRIFHAAASTAVAWSAASPGNGTPGAGPGALLRARHAVFDHLVYGKLRAALGGRVTMAASGGAPLGERLGHFFRGAGVTIVEGYGLTETSPVATLNRPGALKVGTVGQPLPGVTVRIAADGEIELSGPNVFRGYWHNEVATAEILSDGWLRTGDIGALDEDGFLRITGRKKELIVTAGGKNVSPAVLEDRVRAHPLVSQAVVVGDGRPYIGCLITLDSEAVTAWRHRHAQPAGGMAEAAEDQHLLAELQSAVDDANKAVSRAEAIKRFRVLTTDFTERDGYLTPSLKIRRHAVLKDFATEIDQLYA